MHIKTCKRHQNVWKYDFKKSMFSIELMKPYLHKTPKKKEKGFSNTLKINS
jgi:hypothetical protein